MKLNLTTVISALLLLTSCESFFVPEEQPNSYAKIFNEAWTFTDEHYSFFEYKNIDWDSVKAVFEPKVNDINSDEELFYLIADMLYALKDGHVNLSSDFDFSRNWDWYLSSPPNFYEDILEREYFKGEQQYVGPFTIMDFKEENVGYIYYGSFTGIFSSSDLDYILNKFADKRGIILDIRNNGGGLVTNAEALTDRVFYAQNQKIGYQVKKNGPAHDHFTEKEDITSGTLPTDSPQFPFRFVLLTNRKSYSASNMCALYMRSLGVVSIGDSTGGGGGLPVSTELSNGWTLRVSATQLYGLDGLNAENGVPPTIKVDITQNDVLAGRDAILERAFERIKTDN